MSFYIGTAVLQRDDEYVVTATCWFSGTPVFNTRGMTLPFMQQKLLSVITVRNKNAVAGINAAANRTVERLFIRKLVKLPSNTPEDVVLLVPPYLKKNSFVVKHIPDAQHWLVRGAKRATAEWIGAQDVKQQRRRRKRTPKGSR